MIEKEFYELNNGVKIPKIGFGTWMIENDKVAEAVRNAVKVGYRHIDTAEGYMNEVGVGKGVRTSGVSREEIFVTTKLDAFAKSYESAKDRINKSLQDLNIEYIDLVIIHSPEPWTDFREGKHYFKENIDVWKALEEFYAEGKVKAIGVSNFEKEDLENLINNCKVKPMVNQILAHISNTPFELIKYCNEQNILVEAYSPIGHGAILNNEKIKEIANKYNVSVARLCIKYCLQLGLLPLPKTEKIEYMKDNIDVNFTISNEDMEELKNIEQIKNYGESSLFPVYGGKMDKEGNCTPRDFEARK